MAKKKKNWDLVRKQKDTETVKYRDVYEDQQLERGSIAEKTTMTGRLIFAGFLSLLVFLAVWALVSTADMFLDKEGLDSNLDPSDDYIKCESFYYSNTDAWDRISTEEYNEWYKIYHDYDDQRKSTDTPPQAPVDDLIEYRDSFVYDSASKTYSRNGNQYTIEEYHDALKQHENAYNEAYEAYDLYYKRHTDPEYRADDPNSGKYMQSYVLYWNVNDNTYIREEEYERKVAEYNQMVADGKVSEDIQSIPLKPIDWSKIYTGSKKGYILNTDLWHIRGTDNIATPDGTTPEMFNTFISYCAKNSFNISQDPYSQRGVPEPPDPDDETAVKRYSRFQGFYAQLKELFPGLNYTSYQEYWEAFEKYCEAVHYIRNDDGTGHFSLPTTMTCQYLTYRNKYDMTEISYGEYYNLTHNYNKIYKEYWTEYMAHRTKYHPDNIDGQANIFSMKPTKTKALAGLIIAGVVFALLYTVLRKNLVAQNLMSDTSDINQYHNDQHVALPEEVQKNYDWFPDVGAHSAVLVSSMISHMAITNKGLKKITMAERAEKDITDANGDIEYYKGEILLDANGNPKTKELPIIDTDFMDALFTASGAPDDKNVRKYYDPTQIPYNPDNKNRDKLQGKKKDDKGEVIKDKNGNPISIYNTVADLINLDWEFPLYEPQRPGGAYIVDTAPVNTMVLAITRAGKGQTVIEPTIDMWMREKRPNNMVVNDPKGELLVKNYVRATVRGFQVVQFNLINAMKTDIYNPLALAADAAREGDNTKCAMYVENIAEVFFPVDGADDPVWPNAANNAFKRAAYGLIDFYLEEEKAMRRMAERTNIDLKVLEQKIDEMWGKVTLYNCYQLFVQLSSKKMKNPAVEFSNQAKAGKYNDLSDEDYAAELEKVKNKSKLWEDKPEADLLTLYFAATDMLPKNSMRTLVGNANNALKAIGGAEKMMASVYGIAITAMSFFTDPTISTLTSGTLNQNVDLGSLSFPRRMGVRFNSDYIQKYHFIGQQAVWDAFEDENFTKPLGKLFHHDDMVSREGWARYYFDGKFANEIAYVRLEIRNPSTENLIRTFYFKFRKTYQTSLDGRVYMKDPVLEEKIVKNGILVELRKFKKKDGTIVFKEAKTTFEQEKILDIQNKGEKTLVKTNAIISTMARYAEKPKAVFLVTPPHLMKYAKLILILIKQLVDMNFDKSYMTKSNQKPLYKTRYMLDELGNLQSEGHGISGFETMLSIGLGQEQQFTLILQTLQQLKDVYGDSVDKIVQGNTSNIVFLKSTDDSMIETLSKMSGTRHRTYTDSKTITRDMQAMLKMTQNEGKASYTMTTKEEPVIAYNDMAFISERNSIVFRAGDSPIWNRNETILPMSWRLFSNTIVKPGKDYTLQTIPTLSTAMDFDVRKNQPNFAKMLEKRMSQAYIADTAAKSYQDAYGYSDYDMTQIDPDNLSDEIMDLIYSTLNPEEVKQAVKDTAEGKDNHSDDELEEMYDYMFGTQDTKNSKFTVEQDIYNEFETIEDNPDQAKATADAQASVKDAEVLRYAGKMISRDMIVSKMGVNHGLDEAIVRVYKDIRGKMEKDEEYFTISKSGSLCGVDGKVYIKNNTNTDNIEAINEAAKNEDSRVFADQDVSSEDAAAIGSYTVTDNFLRFLISFPGAWPFANGEFETRMKHEMEGTDSSST